MSQTDTNPTHELCPSGMPRVGHRLVCCTCEHAWDAVCSQFEIFDQACPKCKAVDCKVDRSEMSGMCGVMAGGDLIKVRPAWRGRAGVSMAMPLATTAEQQAEWKKDVPSMEWNGSGEVTYRNDAHQRQVLKEMQRAREALTGH